MGLGYLMLSSSIVHDGPLKDLKTLILSIGIKNVSWQVTKTSENVFLVLDEQNGLLGMWNNIYGIYGIGIVCQALCCLCTVAVILLCFPLLRPFHIFKTI